MRSVLKAFTVIAAATLVIVACNQGPLFYAEIEEPAICKTIPDVPFTASQPGQELRYPMAIPIGSLPMFSPGDPDGGTDAGAGDNETEVRLIEFRLTNPRNVTDFNNFETAQVTVQPPSGSTLQAQALVTYVKDPTHLPGTTLVVAGDRGVNLVPYLFDATGMDAGTGSFDAGSGAERSIMVEGTMTGTLPDVDWQADVRVCIYMRTRFNYLNAYGL